MIEPLTKEDIKSLKYECRPGMLFALGIFFLGLLVIFLYLISGKEKGVLAINPGVIIALVLLVIATIFIGFLFTQDYLLDIKNKEKEVKKFTIQKKERKVDYEVGSASLLLRQKMKEFDKYNLSINDCEYNVDKELFERASEGGDVYLHIAPKSEHLLKIMLIESE